jgi:hypothetical protein
MPLQVVRLPIPGQADLGGFGRLRPQNHPKRGYGAQPRDVAPALCALLHNLDSPTAPWYDPITAFLIVYESSFEAMYASPDRARGRLWLSLRATGIR